MAVTAGMGIGAAQASAESGYALSGAGALSTFNTNTPGTLTALPAVTGLTMTQKLVAIDSRPSTGELFGLAQDGTSFQIVRIDESMAVATPVGTTFTLNGSVTAFDFNPTVDRIRLVTDAEENRRIAPTVGGGGTVDTNIVSDEDISGAAYTNNVAGATSTALYYLDHADNDIKISPNPNGGTLGASLPLGVDPVDGDTGFDIAGVSGNAYASLQIADGDATLYRLNLETGAASLLGDLGDGTDDTVDVTVDIAPPAFNATGAETVFAVTGSAAMPVLNSLSTTAPGTLVPIGAITGFGMGESFVGMDVQPRTGRIFAVTKDGANVGRVYTVSKTTGVATPVVAGATFALDGASAYGVDFNPVPDAIRIVSSDELNIRVSQATGAIAGTDTALSPVGNVVGAAYTNPTNGATTTTLYDLDSSTDNLKLQGSLNGSPNSPNGGVLTDVGAAASLGIDTTGTVGFDISPATNVAYAALQPNTGGTSRLHRIDLSTGRAGVGSSLGAEVLDIAVDHTPANPVISLASASFAGQEGGNATVTINRTGNTTVASSVALATSPATASAGDFTDADQTVSFAAGETTKTVDVALLQDGLAENTETISVALSGAMTASLGTAAATINLFDDDQAVSTTGESEKVFGLTGAGGLVTFLSNDPTTVTTVAATVTGLGAGESIVGMDIQPATGRLFAVTIDGSDNGRVYTINKSTGAATVVTTTPFALGAAAKFGVDFNPVPNAIRIVSSDELSLRVSPATGNLAGTDTALAPAGNVVAAAYTNSVAGANSTTLYDIDSASDSLVRQGGLGGSPSPNAGALTTIGALGAAFGEDVGFDISGATNVAYATVQTAADTASLHRIDLSTGKASSGQLVGGVTATDIVDIAVDAQPPSVQFSGATFSAGEAAAKATVTITRTGNTDNASTVSYATSATGNATAGSDFTAIAATPVTFAAGETSKTFDVVLTDDAVVEDPETIGVALSAPTGASLGAPNAATINVFDNDPVAVAVPGPTTTVVVPGAVPPTPADTKRPVLFVLTSSSGKYGSISKGVRADYSCNEKCSLAFTLKLGSTTIGTGKATLNDAGFSATRVKLTTRGRSALAKRVPTGKKNAKKRATITLTTVATDAAGNKTTITKRIVVRR